MRAMLRDFQGCTRYMLLLSYHRMHHWPCRTLFFTLSHFSKWHVGCCIAEVTELDVMHSVLVMEKRTEGGVKVKYGLRSGSESSSASIPAPESGVLAGGLNLGRYGLFGQSSNSSDHVVLPASPKRKADHAELTSGGLCRRLPFQDLAMKRGWQRPG